MAVRLKTRKQKKAELEKEFQESVAKKFKKGQITKATFEFFSSPSRHATKGPFQSMRGAQKVGRQAEAELASQTSKAKKKARKAKKK